jgi:hypothetical protein
MAGHPDIVNWVFLGSFWTRKQGKNLAQVLTRSLDLDIVPLCRVGLLDSKTRASQN